MRIYCSIHADSRKSCRHIHSTVGIPKGQRDERLFCNCSSGWQHLFNGMTDLTSLCQISGEMSGINMYRPHVMRYIVSGYWTILAWVWGVQRYHMHVDSATLRSLFVQSRAWEWVTSVWFWSIHNLTFSFMNPQDTAFIWFVFYLFCLIDVICRHARRLFGYTELVSMIYTSVGCTRWL